MPISGEVIVIEDDDDNRDSDGEIEYLYTMTSSHNRLRQSKGRALNKNEDDVEDEEDEDDDDDNDDDDEDEGEGEDDDEDHDEDDGLPLRPRFTGPRVEPDEEDDDLPPRPKFTGPRVEPDEEDDDLPPRPKFTGPRNGPLPMRGPRPTLRPDTNTSRSQINSTFNKSNFLGNGHSPLFSNCPMPDSGSRHFGGSADQPIDLDEEDVDMGVGPRGSLRSATEDQGDVMGMRQQLGGSRKPTVTGDGDGDVVMGGMGQEGSMRRSAQTEDQDVVVMGSRQISKGNLRRGSHFPPVDWGRNNNKDFAIPDDEDPTTFQEKLSILQTSLEQAEVSTDQDELIDIESLQDGTAEGPEMSRVENIYEEETEARRQRRRKSTIKYHRRNPSIVDPWQRIATTTCGDDSNVTLKVNKTVELRDQSFIRIKVILLNTETHEVRLRGHRLQRSRELNGLLERKLNELIMFIEVDQDDRRLPASQSTVEANVDEVLKIRSVRFTNFKFPLGRNFNPEEFRSAEHAAREGGLTVRWKYTCTYASAADRDHNIFSERTIERLRPEECTPGFEIADMDRRTQWRGETVPGGAYRPALEPRHVIVIPDSPELHSTNRANKPELNAAPVSNPANTVVISDDDETDFLVDGTVPNRKEKRNHSAISQSSEATLDSERPSKRIHQRRSRGVEETSQGVSGFEIRSSAGGSPMAIDQPSGATHPPPPMIDLSSDLPPTIDLISADSNRPARPKTLLSSPPQFKFPPTKIAGQTYTYGDAFCGGGGSSRGAKMAGLHLNWGFDFNKHACHSWRANFPSSTCYQMAAHDFVNQARVAASNGQPDMMKVDILHLSPPCQFFSPAHTVDGVDDEMNVASLFAVQMIIDVARPRIVTLEQTFGIACPRFRIYFNALIQMFTTHDFSVRWAIVTLAQWGLPQRRMRLIVIASCPGESLPKMPLPTHAAPGTVTSRNLHPYVSANTTLNNIPRGTADHNVDSVMWSPDRYMPAWDGSNILPRAMTTSGGQNYHPSGRRDLTLREYACLQGFPTGHVFRGNYVKKQIGNAVPPVVAKVLFGSIKGDLESVDGVEGPELIE